MEKIFMENTFQYYGDYIRHLVKIKGTSIKQMCKDLNIPYRSFISSYDYNRMNATRLVNVSKYLDADLNLMLTLPLKKLKRKDSI